VVGALGNVAHAQPHHAAEARPPAARGRALVDDQRRHHVTAHVQANHADLGRGVVAHAAGSPVAPHRYQYHVRNDLVHYAVVVQGEAARAGPGGRLQPEPGRQLLAGAGGGLLRIVAVQLAYAHRPRPAVGAYRAGMLLDVSPELRPKIGCQGGGTARQRLPESRLQLGGHPARLQI
jgi:hypothetical protein